MTRRVATELSVEEKDESVSFPGAFATTTAALYMLLILDDCGVSFECIVDASR